MKDRTYDATLTDFGSNLSRVFKSLDMVLPVSMIS